MKLTLKCLIALLLLGGSFVSGVAVQKYGYFPNHIVHPIIMPLLYRFLYGDYSEPVDNRLLEAFGTPRLLNKPSMSYVYSTVPELGHLNGSGFESYRFRKHYEEVVNYLVSEQAKKRANEMRDEFWGLHDCGKHDEASDCTTALIDKREYLKDALGIEDLPINGTITHQVTISDLGDVIIEHASLTSRIPDISVPLYIMRPKDQANKGIVIALHGSAGAPDKILGIGAEDYSRSFGKKLAMEGYIVYSPYVFAAGDYIGNISALGMLYTQNTNFSIDLQKILSLVDSIKSDTSICDLPLIAYGISYGGDLSMMLASIDSRIDIVISSGAIQYNRDYFETYYSLERTYSRPSFVIFNRPYQLYFSHATYAGMISPRPLIVELGAYDNMAQNAIGEWKAMQAIYRDDGASNNLRIVWFKGYHETAPELTIPALNEFVQQWPNRAAVQYRKTASRCRS